MSCKDAWGTRCFTRFMAPRPEDTFLLSSPYGYPSQASMVTRRDLAVATWVTRKSLIASVGETVIQYLASV